jgi:HemK-related putative methylase
VADAIGYRCPGDAPEPLESLSLLDESRVVEHCRGVYEPAEDTWLTLGALRGLLARLRPRLCVDVGTGTGVLAAECSRAAGYTVAVDVNPCAALCAARNLRRLAAAAADVAQGDLAAGLRCPLRGPVVYVFNTPYLPPGGEDAGGGEGLLALAWAGGPEPATRLIALAAPCLLRRGGCVVLTTLAAWEPRVAEAAREAGLRPRRAAARRFFFEEVVVVEACSPGYG